VCDREVLCALVYQAKIQTIIVMAAAAAAGRRPEAEEDEWEPPTLYQGQKMNKSKIFG